LTKLGHAPRIYIDGKCPITTPMDKVHNQKYDMTHGTCGVGVGTTLLREASFFSLLFEDLFHPTVFEMKLKILRHNLFRVTDEQVEVFKHCVHYITNHPDIRLVYGIPKNEGLIFEGSQGLLLDQHYGFFPHVTRSNTGSTNIAELGYIPEFWCITRAYQTRHGNGPMTNEGIEHKFDLNPLETNVFNDFQGKFRVSLLNLDLLKYGIMKDALISRHRDNLVITCLDQIQNDFVLTYKGLEYEFEAEIEFINKINQVLQFKNVWISKSDESHNLQKII
jgi:adenylosuccinate synthase